MNTNPVVAFRRCVRIFGWVLVALSSAGNAATVTFIGSALTQSGTASSCTYTQMSEDGSGNWTVTCGAGPKTITAQPAVIGGGCSSYGSMAEDVGGNWNVVNCLSVTSAATIFYVHSDQLRTPRLITQAADNQVRWKWDNTDPFGNSLPNENPTNLGQFTYNLRFPGQYFDQETGTHFNWMRDYDPRVGRYIESDPIGLLGGINTYAYVGGDPLNGIDPRGLATYICTKPLHALGDYGPRVYNPSWWNPLYHQFDCVRDASGKVTCGGQDRSGSAFFPGSPGKPSDDKWPAPGEGECKLQDARQCVDDCVKRKIADPKRPRYAIGPHGTDCQEWSDEVVESCKAECKGKP